MKRFWLLLPAVVACTSLVANAQPGERRGPTPTPRAPAEAPRTERRDNPRNESSVDGWVRTLTDKITDPHDSIRDSARAALVAVGQPALPALRDLANSNDAAKSTAAKKVMEAIERGNRPAGLASRGGFPGGPPMASRNFSTRGFPGGPPMGNRPEGNAREERRPMETRPVEGNRRPDNRPVEGRPETRTTERRPETDRRPMEGNPRPDARPMERRPEGNPRPDARPMERRPEGNPRPEEARRPEANPRPEDGRRPDVRPMDRRPEGNPRPEGERRRTERD